MKVPVLSDDHVGKLEQEFTENSKRSGFLVQDGGLPYTKHDLLFKQLIQNFFQEFLEAFFPDVYKEIDFQTVTFLSEELYTDIVAGETRRLDIVVQAMVKGENTLIIIHIEPQSYEQKNFNERMFQYYSFLYTEHRIPIIPIAVFSYDESWNEDEFSLEVMGEIGRAHV